MVVWIIDVEHWPRAMLRAELIERGYDAVGFETVRDAIDNLPLRRPDVIVIELKGQPMALVERLPKIGVPVIGVGGALELHEPLPAFTRALRRPVSLGEIADEVERLVSSG